MSKTLTSRKPCKPGIQRLKELRILLSAKGLADTLGCQRSSIDAAFTGIRQGPTAARLDKIGAAMPLECIESLLDIAKTKGS